MDRCSMFLLFQNHIRNTHIARAKNLIAIYKRHARFIQNEASRTRGNAQNNKFSKGNKKISNYDKIKFLSKKIIDECNNAHQNKTTYFQPEEGMSNANMVLVAVINPGTLPIVTSQITSTSRKWLWKGGIMRPGMGAQVNSIVHFIAGGR